MAAPVTQDCCWDRGSVCATVYRLTSSSVGKLYNCDCPCSCSCCCCSCTSLCLLRPSCCSHHQERTTPPATRAPSLLHTERYMHVVDAALCSMTPSRNTSRSSCDPSLLCCPRPSLRCCGGRPRAMELATRSNNHGREVHAIVASMTPVRMVYKTQPENKPTHACGVQ